jgi:hypothetical protein
VLKPELTGKQVRCRQCQKAFTVPAARPPDDAEEPIVLSLAEPDPPASAGAVPGLNQNLARGPAIAPPGQEETLAVGTVLPLRGETLLGPVAARRRPQAGNALWRQWLERLLERKLTAAVAVASLGLLFVFVLLFFAAGLPWFFVLPSLAGAGLVAAGMLLPLPKRRRRQGPWLDPAAARLAVGTGVFGLVFAVVFGILFVAGLCGFPIPRALGMSRETAIIVVAGLFWAIGVCFAACILTLVVSAAWSLARQYGFVRVFNFLYLGASPVILLVFCVCGLASQVTRARPPVAYQPPASQADRNTNLPPGWPSNQTPSDSGQTNRGVNPMWPDTGRTPPRSGRMPAGPFGPVVVGPFDVPPPLRNPNDPEFYRTALAELRSADLNHRRAAVAQLIRAQPKELREEIAKALEALMDDPDEMLRTECLMALAIWSTDVVPIAIHATRDSSVFIRNSAIGILERRKDPRTIETLVVLLSDPRNMRVAHCLEQMGSQVEDALLARYDSGNEHAKRMIIQILGVVATEKGIVKLREIAADKSDFASAALARMMLRRRGVSVGN